MSMIYLENCDNLEGLERQFTRLKTFLGRDEKIMARLEAEYKDKKAELENAEEIEQADPAITGEVLDFNPSADNTAEEPAPQIISKTAEQPVKTQIEARLKNKLEALKGLNELTLELVGSWLWIDGKTYPVKDKIKAAGALWSSKHKRYFIDLRVEKSQGKYPFANQKTFQAIKETFGYKLLQDTNAGK